MKKLQIIKNIIIWFLVIQFTVSIGVAAFHLGEHPITIEMRSELDEFESGIFEVKAQIISFSPIRQVSATLTQLDDNNLAINSQNSSINLSQNMNYWDSLFVTNLDTSKVDDGNYRLLISATNVRGRMKTEEFKVKIDNSPPVLALIENTGISVPLELKASDWGAGVSKVEYSIDDQEYVEAKKTEQNTYRTDFIADNLESRRHSITLKVIDNAGNVLTNIFYTDPVVEGVLSWDELMQQLTLYYGDSACTAKKSDHFETDGYSITITSPKEGEVLSLDYAIVRWEVKGEFDYFKLIFNNETYATTENLVYAIRDIEKGNHTLRVEGYVNDDLMAYDEIIFDPNIEDYVDNNTSDIDSSADIGTHSNFVFQQNGPDSFYDMISESAYIDNTYDVDAAAILEEIDAQTEADSDAKEVKDHTDDLTDKDFGSKKDIFEKDTVKDFACYGRKDLDPENYDKIILRVGIGRVEVSSMDWRIYVYQSNADDINTGQYIDPPALTPSDEDTWKEIDVTDIAHTLDGEGFVKFRIVSMYLADDKKIGIAELEVNFIKYCALDLEVQWTSADFDEMYEELCIYVGSIGTEIILVDVWDGSTWQNVMTGLSANSWNNVSISDYLTSNTSTIRFKGSQETADINQDSWQIDATLLHTWTPPDEDPPIILWGSNQFLNETVASSSIHIDIDASDPSGISTVWYRIYNVSASQFVPNYDNVSIDSPDYETDVDISSWSTSSTNWYYVEVFANDTLGNENTTASISNDPYRYFRIMLTIDVSIPSVSYIGGTTQTIAITGVTATCPNHGVLDDSDAIDHSYTVYTSGGTPTSVTGDLTWTGSEWQATNIDVSSLPEGDYYVRCYFRDGDGDGTSLPSNSFTISHVITVSSPTVTYNSISKLINITDVTAICSYSTHGIIDDTEAIIYTYRVYISGIPTSITGNLEWDNIESEWKALNIDVSSLPDGTYYVTCYFEDADAIGSSPASNTFDVDTTPPSISLNSPSNSTTQQGGTIVDLSVTGDVVEVLYAWDIDSNSTLTDPYDIVLPTGDGWHDLYVYTRDAVYNWDVKHYRFQTDDTPPLISLNSPNNGTTQVSGTTIDLSISGSPTEVLYNWDGALNSSLADPYDISLPIGEGWHDLFVYARDAANNWDIKHYRFETIANGNGGNGGGSSGSGSGGSSSGGSSGGNEGSDSEKTLFINPMYPNQIELYSNAQIDVILTDEGELFVSGAEVILTLKNGTIVLYLLEQDGYYTTILPTDALGQGNYNFTISAQKTGFKTKTKSFSIEIIVSHPFLTVAQHPEYVSNVIQNPIPLFTDLMLYIPISLILLGVVVHMTTFASINPRKLRSLYVFTHEGHCVYYRTFGKDGIDSQLMTAALSGIIGLVMEATSSDKPTRTVDQETFEILLEYGRVVTIACFVEKGTLNKRKIRRQQKSLVHKFEQKYENTLANWKGDLSVFHAMDALIFDAFDFKITEDLSNLILDAAKVEEQLISTYASLCNYDLSARSLWKAHELYAKLNHPYSQFLIERWKALEKVLIIESLNPKNFLRSQILYTIFKLLDFLKTPFLLKILYKIRCFIHRENINELYYTMPLDWNEDY
jgi:hypothetical protein